MKRIFVLITGVSLFVSCNNQPKETSTASKNDSASSNVSSAESKQEKNKQTALASIEGIKSLNADMVLKDATADAVDYGDGSMGVVKGLDSVKAGLKMWLGSLEYFKGHNLITTANDNYVLIYGEWEGKYKSDFMGMKTAGKTYKVKDVDIFKFNDDGKITEHRSVQSPDTYMKSMGITMPKH